MSYYSDTRYGLDYSRTPSQFAIVGVSDGTQVEITPKVATYVNGNVKQTITLNKGDVYLVQALIDDTTNHPDLTGSKITSDKPIAIFSGQQRSLIPASVNTSNPSRDYLCEQIPPVSTWGKNAFLIPPKEAVTTNSEKGSLFRILAAFDNTILTIDGTNTINLKSGQFFESSFSKPVTVSSNLPILAAVFKYTSSLNGSAQNLGDPFMMLIPPKEQFLTNCRVNNVQAWEIGTSYTPEKIYLEQYITIVAPDTSVVKIDNIVILSTDFTKIGNSGYSYVTKSVTDGVHAIDADKPVGIYIYGYGYANSYGYIGGMSFNQINKVPPKITEIPDCYKIDGIISVNTGDNKDMVKLWNTPDSLKNVNLSIGPKDASNKSIKFSANLIDKRKDGSFDIYGIDSDTLLSHFTSNIAGFTLSVPGYENSSSLPVYNVTVKDKKVFCFNIPVINYSKKHNMGLLSNAGFVKNSKQFTVQSYPKKLIKPGETDSVNICFQTDTKGKFSDTLFIQDSCGKFNIALINVSTPECGTEAFSFPKFNDRTNLRLNGVTNLVDKYIRLTNAEMNRVGALWYSSQVPLANGFSTEFAFRFTYGNNYQCDDGSLPGADGIAFVIQNAGIDALGFYGGGIGYDGIFNSLAVEFDTYSNDSTQIENFYDPNGNHLAVQSNGKNANSSKHMPKIMKGMNKSILPLKADGTLYYVKIEYITVPNTLNIYLDTISNFSDPVLSVNNINLDKLLNLTDSSTAFIGFTSATGCAVENHDILSWTFCPEVSGSSTDYKDKNITENSVKLYPNPFSENITLDLNLNSDSYVLIEITDLFGNLVQTVNNTFLGTGYYQFNWNPDKISQGIYLCRININGKTSVQKINFIK